MQPCSAAGSSVRISPRGCSTGAADAIDAAALADAYQRVERAFDFPHTPSRHADPGLDATLAEALFLPAAAKHVYASRLARRLDRAIRIRYLHAAGKDILHLGGGLAPARRDARSVLAPDFSFPAACNAYVISTAVFARPGVVNPTHTLLALAEWLLPRL
jgi:hypothetical protein